MTSTKRLEITTVIGRFVYGSLYKPYTHDVNGQLLVYKSGPDAGKPRVEYRIGIAIRKNGEQHWNQTPWGAQIFSFAQQAFQNRQYENPNFAWKITDGDSTFTRTGKGKKPCEREGYPGHWILNFSNSIAPVVCTTTGQKILEEDAVRPGDYIQIYGDINKNTNDMNPGLFFNLKYVAHAGDGERIQHGPDPTQVGFGGQLPQGARPPSMPGQRIPDTMPLGQPTGFVQQAPMAAAPAFVQQAPTMPNVQPYPAILNVPGQQQSAMPPTAPPAAPVTPQKIIMPTAGNFSYNDYIAAGWTDQGLIDAGLMVIK